MTIAWSANLPRIASFKSDKVARPMATRNQAAIAEVFNKYDAEKTGFITKAQLKDCIFDLNGRQLDDVELNHIFELMEGDNSGISLTKFTNVMEQFFRYC
jgi:Ca2+-binding EF-hand superfamily protein